MKHAIDIPRTRASGVEPNLGWDVSSLFFSNLLLVGALSSPRRVPFSFFVRILESAYMHVFVSAKLPSAGCWHF